VSGAGDEDDVADEQLFMQESLELHYNVAELVGKDRVPMMCTRERMKEKESLIEQSHEQKSLPNSSLIVHSFLMKRCLYRYYHSISLHTLLFMRATTLLF
jgi:hypothetical protein